MQKKRSVTSERNNMKVPPPRRVAPRRAAAPPAHTGAPAPRGSARAQKQKDEAVHCLELKKEHQELTESLCLRRLYSIEKEVARLQTKLAEAQGAVEEVAQRQATGEEQVKAIEKEKAKAARKTTELEHKVRPPRGGPGARGCGCGCAPGLCVGPRRCLRARRSSRRCSTSWRLSRRR